MQKNLSLFLLVIAAVVVLLVVGVEGWKGRNSGRANNLNTTVEVNAPSAVSPSDVSIEGLDEAMKGVEDLKLDLADPALEFDVSF